MQLLELLRRLRQRVELARMQPRRHQDSRARLPGEDAVRIGVWNSKKPCSFIRRRMRIDDRAALHDVPVELLATQVEETVLEPYVLRIFLLAEHRHRELAGRPQDLHPADEQLDRAGRQIRILGAGRAAAAPCRRARTTHSERSFSISLKTGESGSATHWVMP